MASKLRVAIECRIYDHKQGVGTAVQALAKALSDSSVADQEYTFIVQEERQAWLEPYVYGPCTLHTVKASKSSSLKAAIRWIRPLRWAWHQFCERTDFVPISDGYVESHQFDVVHFPTQAAYLTKLPTIYQPWDLQHLHYPQFFSKSEFTGRERLYRAFCGQAACVCVQTQWTKQDLVEQYKISEDKVAVIPWGSVLDAYRAPSEEEVGATIRTYGLPAQFFFYPAVTWPHKNHQVIFQALQRLKVRYGLCPHVVFTGSSTDYRSILDTLAEDLCIADQLHFLGFVTPVELQAIFRSATAMLFPSRFEGFGLPILEAFHAGLPVLCSSATTLPEVARDGALYFDPDSPDELCELMKSILDSPHLRKDLIQKGAQALSQYSIYETAAKFQALYARTAESL